MPNYIGLYYPSIYFKDDSWTKLAALYWDKMGRIVPSGASLEDDSDTVKALTQELGFIRNISPSRIDEDVVSSLFIEMLRHHPEALRSLYGVDSEPDPNMRVVVGTWGMPNAPRRLLRSREIEMLKKQRIAVVAQGKISETLMIELLDTGLAYKLPLSHSDRDYTDIGEFEPYLAMHPKLAYIYMEVLAEQMASSRNYYPVTDNAIDHLAMSGYSIERLTQALLQPNLPVRPESQPLAAYEIEIQMATIALQSIFPQDIATIPTKKIIRLRNRYRDEMTVFQTYIHELVADLDNLQNITDPLAIKAHLEVQYEKGLKPQLDNLRKCLKSLGIDTVMGALNIRLAIPALVAGAGPLFHIPPLDPILAGGGAIAFGLIPVIQAKQKEASQIIHSSPAAYLLYAQEGLRPATLLSQVTHQARKMIFRV